MSTHTLGRRPGEFHISEANGSLSREVVTVTGGNYGAGAVLGKITASGKYKLHDPAAADGSETAAAVLFGPVDATAADQPAVVIARLAEVQKSALGFKAGMTGAEQALALADLALVHVIAR